MLLFDLLQELFLFGLLDRDSRDFMLRRHITAWPRYIIFLNFDNGIMSLLKLGRVSSEYVG